MPNEMCTVLFLGALACLGPPLGLIWLGPPARRIRARLVLTGSGVLLLLIPAWIFVFSAPFFVCVAYERVELHQSVHTGMTLQEVCSVLHPWLRGDPIQYQVPKVRFTQYRLNFNVVYVWFDEDGRVERVKWEFD